MIIMIIMIVVMIMIYIFGYSRNDDDDIHTQTHLKSPSSGFDENNHDCGDDAYLQGVLFNCPPPPKNQKF